MLNVYLLRHGETAWNADNNRYCGRTDLELTSIGITQALNVRQQLKDVQFEAVYSSPLRRAVRTAILASGTEEVIADGRLIEADFGDWEGKCKEEFIADDPAYWENWINNPATMPAGKNGETAKQIIERVNEFFASLLQRHRSGNVLVVAHNTVNRFYLSHKLGMPLCNYRRIFFENSSVSMFELTDSGELTLKLLNSKSISGLRYSRSEENANKNLL